VDRLQVGVSLVGRIGRIIAVQDSLLSKELNKVLEESVESGSIGGCEEVDAISWFCSVEVLLVDFTRLDQCNYGEVDYSANQLVLRNTKTNSVSLTERLNNDASCGLQDCLDRRRVCGCDTSSGHCVEEYIFESCEFIVADTHRIVEGSEGGTGGAGVDREGRVIASECSSEEGNQGVVEGLESSGAGW
jgi:hypothetical protein